MHEVKPGADYVTLRDEISYVQITSHFITPTYVHICSDYITLHRTHIHYNPTVSTRHHHPLQPILQDGPDATTVQLDDHLRL